MVLDTDAEMNFMGYWGTYRVSVVRGVHVMKESSQI